MAPISRGFHGRRRSDVDPARVPRGQYVVDDFPVLSAGPTPHTPLEQWSFQIGGAVGAPASWTWEQFQALGAETFTVDIHCVTKWSKLGTSWTGVSVDTLLEGVETEADYFTAWCDGGYTTNLALEDVIDGKGWVVYAFEGEPLQAEHGGPARLLTELRDSDCAYRGAGIVLRCPACRDLAGCGGAAARPQPRVAGGRVDVRDAASLSAPAAIVAVLAGGRGERIGGDKPTRALAGRPLIDYSLAAAREAGLEALVVAKGETQLPSRLAERVLVEPDEPRHPLCGVIAALEHAAQSSPAPGVVLVGCDMPFLTAALLAWLAAALEPAVLLELEGRPQPLPACCRAEHLPLLREALATEAPLREALQSLAPAIVGERELAYFGDPRRLCFSVNSAEDLATAERLLVRGDGGAEP